MALLLFLLIVASFRPGSLAPTENSSETISPSIASLAERLLREFEGEASQDIGHETTKDHGEQHSDGYSHQHEHKEYDGHHHEEQVHQSGDGLPNEESHRHVEHHHQHQDGTTHAHLLPIYDSIRNEKAEILTQIERLYTEYQSHYSGQEGHKFPMVRLLYSSPNSMTLMVSPKTFRPDTMIRLMYERVPMNRKPCLQHLDDPVVEYHPLIRNAQTYTLTGLPRGKYIVCGEAMDELGENIIQASCFETQIKRKDENRLQHGVRAMIVIAFLVVTLVVIYALLYQICKKRCYPEKNKKPEKK